MPSNDVMAYGGQTNYGLDLGQRKIYADMRKSPTDSASSSMTEKDNLGPDEEYRIVAENNETIVGDFDQSGELGFQTIKGDYHSAPSGGTYLTNKQAVDGAYIFPQTKSMYIKDKNFLEQLGIKFKKGGRRRKRTLKNVSRRKSRKVMMGGGDNVTYETLKKQLENDMTTQQLLERYNATKNKNVTSFEEFKKDYDEFGTTIKISEIKNMVGFQEGEMSELAKSILTLSVM